MAPPLYGMWRPHGPEIEGDGKIDMAVVKRAWTLARAYRVRLAMFVGLTVVGSLVAAYVRGEDAVRLSQALAKLPEDEQQALRLRYLEGRTLAEVCDEMELTKDALVWLMKTWMMRVTPRA